ncbi:MAG: hypothetical protein V7640_930, partial [Betaproteobacteria bacterium]
MIRFFRFSPSRLALSYIALSVLMLVLFAVPLWYVWNVNISTFRAYVHGEDMQRMLATFDRGGATALAAAIDAQVGSEHGDEIMLLADASKARLAGNLPAWPAEMPDSPGTYGLALDLGGSSMRVVASHVRLPDGSHFLMGRESARFQSLTDYFWYGITGATGIVLVLGAVVGWMSRRALLSEVHEISRTASAIVDGDLSRRLETRGASSELDTLALTVNGMLERLATQNVQLEEEIAVRREAEQALHHAHHSLEALVEQRTAQLARANESLRRSEAFLAEGQKISRTGSWGWDLSTRKVIWSEEQYRLLGFDPGTVEPSVNAFLKAVHPDDRPGIQRKLEEAAREKQSYAIDYRVVFRDGTVRHLRSVGRSDRCESDNVEEYIGVTTDVTERRHAEDELRRQKAHLDELFDLAPDAIVLTRVSHPSIIRVNRAFTRMFGYTSSEAVGRRLRSLIAPHELHPANLTLDPELLSGNKVEREVVRRRKDGTLFHAHITAARIRFEDVQDAAYVTYRDISERKRAEALLAGENRVLEMIAKGSSLTATLDTLCRLMEEIFCGSLSSIILIDSDGRLHPAAAPSLPEGYTAQFDGALMGPCAGPCGVAAFKKEPVIVNDIETYPHSDAYRSIAAAHGLRACWSTPVFSSDGKVLGTFAIFYREPRSPNVQEATTIQQFSHLASIVIERTEAVTALRRSEERFA